MAPHTLDALLTQLLDRPEEEPAPPFSRAVDGLQQDPGARARLLARYENEADPHARSRIRAVLSFIPTPDVVAFGMRMGSDGDTRVRREGFQLLHTIQMASPEAREILIGALSSEQDPDTLSAAIASLVPDSAEKPEDVNQLLEHLKRTAEHPSPEVRAESLLARVRWAGGDGSEDIIYAGITDPHTPVREAAMTALFEKPVHSDRLKTALLDVASGRNGEPRMRIMAVEALGGFQLTQQEHDVLAEVRSQMPAEQ